MALKIDELTERAAAQRGRSARHELALIQEIVKNLEDKFVNYIIDKTTAPSEVNRARVYVQVLRDIVFVLRAEIERGETAEDNLKQQGE